MKVPSIAYYGKTLCEIEDSVAGK